MTAPASIPTADAIASLDSLFWRWSGPTVTYSIATPGSTWPGYGGTGEPASSDYTTLNTTQAANFRTAMALWDELIAFTFVETDDVAATGMIRVAGTGTGFWGFAYYPGFGDKAGDIWIGQSVLATATLAPGTDDFESLLHEIGHALGLKHPFETPFTLPTAYDNSRYSVMSYTSAPGWAVTFSATAGGGIASNYANLTMRTPGMFDILAIQSFYGADTATRAGNTTYSFAADAAALQVLYDAGGIDTFDLSGQTRPSILDLRPGAFSSVNHFADAARIEAEVARFGEGFRSFITNVVTAPGVFDWSDNVGIAYGTIIENALLGSGADSVLGNAAANRFTGGAGGDTLWGAAGNDTLDGGTGGDRLIGGVGNDVYYVDSTLDVVSEAAGGGLDTVITRRTAFVLGAEVEVLRAAVGAPVSFVGNAIGNTISSTAFADTLNGMDGDDLLSGLGAADRLLGALGNDRLLGGAGQDSLLGGAGNDTLWGQDDDDRIWGEAGNDWMAGGNGADGLIGSDGADTLLGEAAADVLNGGTGADSLAGGEGNDLLLGGAGADRLLGGPGADSFRFLSPAEGGDSIADLAFAEGDRVVLTGSAFGLAAGALLVPGVGFIAGASAAPVAAAPSFLFNPATGVLRFDADGTGAGAAITLATLAGAPAVSAASIVFA